MGLSRNRDRGTVPVMTCVGKMVPIDASHNDNNRHAELVSASGHPEQSEGSQNIANRDRGTVSAMTCVAKCDQYLS